MYSYFNSGNYIYRVYSWRVKHHNGRFAPFVEVNEALWRRAKKYGFIAVAID